MTTRVRDAKDLVLSLPNDHPLQIAIRTYPLALSLSLGPSLLSFLASSRTRTTGLASGLKSILLRELGITSFPFAITVAIGGGSGLQFLWKHLERKWTKAPRGSGESGFLARLEPWQKTFVCNVLASLTAIILLHARRRPVQTQKVDIPIPCTVPIARAREPERGHFSATLDLTLLVLVRAFDALAQRIIFKRAGNEKKQARKRRLSITTKLDALAFWASSAGIMWCFFYEPERLPRSYVKWIGSLANIDNRIVTALRAIRSKQWSYVHGTSPDPNPLALLSRDLGYSAQWGDPKILPAYGGYAANAIWKPLGVHGRGSVGGLPCEIVHGSVTGGSCTGNVTIRGVHAFLEALALYLPVHVLPILIRRPQKLLSFPAILDTFLGIVRSASFLSAFVSSFWAAVCFTRTLVVARALPRISHDFYDGPFGCVLAGCLACGGSIWVESGRRRGEMALYVLPRAIRVCLPNRWLRSGRKSVYAIERAVFTLSLATLLTTAVHHPETLRGLSRWTLGFVLRGPNVVCPQDNKVDARDVRMAPTNGGTLPKSLNRRK
ncbi:hypothetical protein EDB92DRAFT_1792946 [Lactarius akahatsu]|uniref:Transmembrane protein 135 N-terminal domain-containing protein n=1 Tax=Lactarius akahatsu TaxID=416441 RepID=A0AAD4LMJ7_9AGAM|nr:hypothetical protein EDB92DRAFT_1792946 [Lactarius akahatsu]